MGVMGEYAGVQHDFDGWKSYAGEQSLGSYNTEWAAALIHDLYILGGIKEYAPVPSKALEELNFSATLLSNNPDLPEVYYSTLNHAQCFSVFKEIHGLYSIKDSDTTPNIDTMPDIDEVLKQIAAGVYDDVSDDVEHDLSSFLDDLDYLDIVYLNKDSTNNLERISPKTVGTDTGHDDTPSNTKRQRKQ